MENQLFDGKPVIDLKADRSTQYDCHHGHQYISCMTVTSVTMFISLFGTVIYTINYMTVTLVTTYT